MYLEHDLKLHMKNFEDKITHLMADYIQNSTMVANILLWLPILWFWKNM